MAAHSRTVVITGISRGIGQALAQEYVRQGFRVFGCARSRPKQLLTDTQFIFQAVDVAKNSEVQEWAKEVQKHGSPHILINNAAIVNTLAPLWKIPSADFDRLIDINIKGVANVLRAFVPLMLPHKSGIIVNMSSGWGRHGDAFVSSYCASKFAIEGMTQSLAQEFPKGIIAVALSPGIVQTDMLRTCAPDSFAEAMDPKSWAKEAVSFIDGLVPKDNGKSLSCPE